MKVKFSHLALCSLGIIFLITGPALWLVNGCQPLVFDTTSQTTTTVERSKTISNGSFTINIGDYEDIPATITRTVNVTGNFKVTGGDVNFYILDETNFEKFEESLDFEGIIRLNDKDSGSFNLQLKPGTYHFVLHNKGLYKDKTVSFQAVQTWTETNTTTTTTRQYNMFVGASIALLTLGVIFTIVGATSINKDKKKRLAVEGQVKLNQDRLKKLEIIYKEGKIGSEVYKKLRHELEEELKS